MDNTEKLYIDSLKGLVGVTIKTTADDISLQDRWQTAEQQKRDKEISNLLSAYVDAYNAKVDFICIHRGILTKIILFSLLFVAIAISVIAVISVLDINQSSTGNVIKVITALVSLTGIIIGLLKVITEYIFPKDDEKYITQIVSSIQSNDLENKRENIHASKDEH